MCIVHDFESSRVEANLGPRPDTWTDARKELQTCQCILIPLIKVFPNLRIRGLKKDWGRENGEGLMELEIFSVNVLRLLDNFGKINFLLKRFKKNLKIREGRCQSRLKVWNLENIRI